jgi:hypothetical protein
VTATVVAALEIAVAVTAEAARSFVVAETIPFDWLTEAMYLFVPLIVVALSPLMAVEI